MKILLVHNEYQQPGGEDVVFRLEEQLLSLHGHAVLTYVRSNHEINRMSVRRRLLFPKQLVWAEDSLQDVARILEAKRPDVVHVHNTFAQISPSVYTACRGAGIPVVQTLHNFRLLCPGATFYRDGKVCEECAMHSLWHSVAHGCYRGSRSATAAVAAMLAAHRSLHTWSRNVDTYIALTEFARRKFIQQGIPPEKIRVKPNFVSPDPGPGDRRGDYALFVGRLSEEKGLRTLLSAWALLKKPVRLSIIGDGPLRAELEEYAAAYSLSQVSFFGRLGRLETQDAIKRARFLVLPSACYENFPMTIVEAFAGGTPVICSRLGSMQEIVEAGRTGLHFEPNDSQDLADKVSWAWAHCGRMTALGKEGRQEYEEKYTAEKNHSLLMDIYQSTAGEPSSIVYEHETQDDLVQAVQPWD